MTDIAPPDLETRMAILQQKAAIRATNISQDVIEFVAKQVQSNVRELEGALTRLFAMSDMTGKAITIQFARDTLVDLVGPRTHYPFTGDRLSPSSTIFPCPRSSPPHAAKSWCNRAKWPCTDLPRDRCLAARNRRTARRARSHHGHPRRRAHQRAPRSRRATSPRRDERTCSSSTSMSVLFPL